MHEILRELQAGSRVLDLGCAGGSFASSVTLARIVRVDRDAHNAQACGAAFVRADARELPFPDQSFAAVIANHSLEHFNDLDRALSEIRRVVRPGGSLFVAVPDASTLTDKLYRWLAQGGGHVNPFTSAQEAVIVIERATGLPHVATRLLYSSLSFLNRRNAPRPRPRRLLLLGAGFEWSLFIYAWLSRRVDRLLRTRSSIYGWAFYFGAIGQPVDTAAWVNVCIRCGSGCPASTLKATNLVRLGLIRTFRCAQCNAINPFAKDLDSGVNSRL